MIRVLSVILLIASAWGCQTPTQFDRNDLNHVLVTFATDDGGSTSFRSSKRSYHQGTWTVSLHVRRTVQEIAELHQITESKAWPITSLSLLCVVYAVPPGLNLNELVTNLNEDKRVITVHPMQEYQGMLSSHYDDPLFELQYGDHQDQLAAIHAITRGEKIRVGVIDGHVDTRHPDLSGQIRKLYSLVDGKTSVSDQRHGTAIAGIIGATADNGEGLVGLAPSAILNVYAACVDSGPSTRCTSFHLAQALDHAITDHIDVLNLSLAGPPDPLLQRLIERAQQQGMVIVAAENSANPRRNFPASLPDVQAAHDNAEPWFARNEQFSTQAGGGYQVFYGSSVAAAGVAGAAALLRSQYTSEKTNELLALMLNATCTEKPLRSPLLDSLYAIEECR